MPAGLAVNSIDLVPLQTTFLASVGNLVGPDDRLCEPDKEGDADNHGDDRRELAKWARQRDVAKSRRGHRRDREIESVYEADETALVIEERRVDKSCHHEEENQEV